MGARPERAGRREGARDPDEHEGNAAQAALGPVLRGRDASDAPPVNQRDDGVGVPHGEPPHEGRTAEEPTIAQRSASTLGGAAPAHARVDAVPATVATINQPSHAENPTPAHPTSARPRACGRART